MPAQGRRPPADTVVATPVVTSLVAAAGTGYDVATTVATEMERLMDTAEKTAREAVGAWRELDRGEVVAITHRTLKNEQGRVFREIGQCGVVAVRNRDRIDGILMSPSSFADLRERADDGVRLRAALPLLLAAARTGVAIPSETFDALGIPGREDWKALNELLTSVPVPVTHGENGEPLADMSVIELRHEPVAELDDELTLR